MIKKIIKYFLYFLILIFIGILYLSYFGIETKRFNQLIKNEVSKVNKKINIELKDVKILLNLSNFSIDLKTYEPNLVFDNKKIKLKNIKTNFSLGSFLKKEFAIKNVSISTKENNLKDVVSLARVYQNTSQLLIFNKMIKNGTLVTDINFNFNDKLNNRERRMLKRNHSDNLISNNTNSQIGFNRLAILDLSNNANQPIISSSGQYSMV